MPSTFASAAAGNSNDGSARRMPGRSDSGSVSEWGRRPNGATQTFRRPSLAINAASQNNVPQREPTQNVTSPPAQTGTYVPPHISASRNGADTRYSKEQLLDLFRSQKDDDELEDDVSDIFVGDWDRHFRHDESLDASIGPEICLEPGSLTHPLGLHDLTAEEREVFTSSVNSQLKSSGQGGQREGQHRDLSGARKMSFSQREASGSVSSPMSARPFGRRRDTGESFPFPKEAVASPSTAKSAKDDPMSALPNPLMRRRTDLKDISGERNVRENAKENEEEGGGPFGLSRRISSGPLSAGLGGPSSPWSTGGLGSLGAANTSGPTQKRTGALNRSESRFKNLVNRESAENMTGIWTLSENMNKRQEADEHSSSPGPGIGLSSGDRPFGSAALGGANDESALENLRSQTFGPTQPRPFSGHHGAYRHNANEAALTEQRSPFQQQNFSGEPSSPTFTNPYQSPEGNLRKLNEYDPDDPDIDNLHLPGLGGLGSGPGARSRSQLDAHGLDRNQAPPSATQRGFSNRAGLGTMPGSGGGNGQWPTALGVGTPLREQSLPGFGDFHAQEEGFNNQTLAGLGGLGSYSADAHQDSNRAFGGRGLGSLFPSGMQDQMGSQDPAPFAERSRAGYDPFAARTGELSGFPRGGMARDIDSPFGQARMNENMSHEENFADSPAHTPPTLHQQFSPENLVGQDAFEKQVNRGTSTDHDQPPNQPPAAQQKQMVMPDRIRWIYRDPQGNTQGPWSGLEMHDWYRAGFFSPELLVKKVEDADYEPLAQLIRRIGNSREPFLVPQIGIPGPPSTSGSWHQPPPAATAPATSAPSAQPPFASSFPSFGTTLTAEQQNALERRKQEEQYLMARQKEHLAQQQLLAKQRTGPGSAGHGIQQQQQQQQQQPLQHQTSVQSLQSQPSYGSMGGLGGTQSGGRPVTGGFEPGFRGTQDGGAAGSGFDGLGMSQDEEAERLLGRLDLGHSATSAFDNTRQMRDQPGLDTTYEHDERMANMLADRDRLQTEAAEMDYDGADEAHSDPKRLRQFHELQQSREDHHPFEQPEPTAETFREVDVTPSHRVQRSSDRRETPEHKLTLTEQVQRAASAKQSPSSATNSPWATKLDKPITESHPTFGTSSPLPAPAARRNGRQSVADALAAESSKPSSPAVETPSASIAPWAAQASEGTQKQPSLKEIQEAEARRAAKRDEEQSALRRAALERELAAQPVAPAPGLPSSSTWGSNEGVATPSGNAPSAWAKANPKTVATPGDSKKTLQQIQKEEEALAKRQKAAVAATASVNPNAGGGVANSAQAISAGKRYADLASKVAAPAPNSSSAWTTVGASGKAKTPSTPLQPALQRTATTGSISNTAAAPAAVKKPVAGPVRAKSSGTMLTAYDEFKKWAVGELRSDLNNGVDAQDLVTTLLDFPVDKDLITETVHSASNTIDSRHFAEEFIKRRALADKGKSQPAANLSGAATNSSQSGSGGGKNGGGGGGGGGWSEVASKRPGQEKKEDAAFKIVAKKRGVKK